MSFGYTHIDFQVTQQFKKLGKKHIVADLGTSKRFAKELASFRHFLEKTQFKALGYKPEMKFGEDNCDLDGDLLNLPFDNNYLDMALCIEVIEHVRDPFKALQEIYRVTKPKGKVILTTPFLLPYHGKGNDKTNFAHNSYPDFWRYTYQGLEVLFEDFKEVTIWPFTNTIQYYTNKVARFEKVPILMSAPIQNFLHGLQQPHLGCTTHRHLVIAQK